MTRIVVTLRMSTDPDLTPEALAALVGQHVLLWLPDEIDSGTLANVEHADIGLPAERVVIALDRYAGDALPAHYVDLRGVTVKVERHGPLFA